jgi:uncharacterized membrane protein
MAAEKAGFVISTDKNGEKIFLVKETEIGTGKDLTLESQQNKNTINRNEGKLQVDQGVAKAKIEKAKADISNQKEVGTKASDAATNDHQKIMHPEQRQPGETKPSLQKDENSQTNKAANAASEIKKDVKEIVEVKSRMRR